MGIYIYVCAWKNSVYQLPEERVTCTVAFNHNRTVRQLIEKIKRNYGLMIGEYFFLLMNTITVKSFNLCVQTTKTFIFTNLALSFGSRVTGTPWKLIKSKSRRIARWCRESAANNQTPNCSDTCQNVANSRMDFSKNISHMTHFSLSISCPFKMSGISRTRPARKAHHRKLFCVIVPFYEGKQCEIKQLFSHCTLGAQKTFIPHWNWG